jgi:biopolymer transport protein ExbB
MSRLIALLIALSALLPASAMAWWNADWAQRRSFTLDTTATGANIRESQTGFALPLRLHTGNFPFAEANENGADLRVIAADGKTPLKFHIEKFDTVNELALLWIHLPILAGNAKKDGVWLYWGNAKATSAAEHAVGYDESTLAVYHFAQSDGPPKDATAYGHHAANAGGLAIAPDGPLGQALKLSEGAGFSVPASPALKLAAGGGFTLSVWVRPAKEQTAVLFEFADANNGIAVALEGLTPVARVTAERETFTAKGGALIAGRWNHLAVTIGERVAIFVNGKEAASAAGKLPAIAGEVRVGRGVSGTGFAGDIDELALASIARTPAWVEATFASQSQDAKLLLAGDQEGGSGGSSYFRILLDAVTLDGWIVIGILMVMMLVSFAIMIGKAIFVNRTERANNAFLERFAALRDDLAALYTDAGEVKATASGFERSSLYRLYEVGMRELKHRFERYRTLGAAEQLSPQAINAIRASLDAGLTRESHRLNSQMVLLTIAISGGPFLGLLGTVVGVMITFAAIAAAGDVNVNSIAPGIAAALVATVAGLAVAIPALFGYNYLASRIRNITTDMQVFADELLTKLAERHSM